ncbi:unnamed protein product [Mycena citricolor]|uniref:C3H1-type domain-containing protein n=1 Tax=Mycena citricolor TaxID=2018698 RepID=A0AAD2H169_9AGAR|nr:unnamed protein product [Mycena citricolor]
MTFERAMAWLVDRAMPPAQSGSQIRGQIQQMGGRVTVVPRDAGRGRGDLRSPPRYVNGRPVPNGNRVCRYFVAGECLRADCRFSHDLERAFVSFLASRHLCQTRELRIPPSSTQGCGLDQSKRGNAASERCPGNRATCRTPCSDGCCGSGRFSRLGRQHSASRQFRRVSERSRQNPLCRGCQEIGACTGSASSSEAMGNSADNLYHRSAIVAPRPSPRLKLHAPTLLPTLPTGDAVNNMYMTYRSRALQLGAARNACLSRAADAWRRGDGAAAKRFSREGHELNDKMAKEMRSAAERLVRERASIVEEAVRSRDASWSDDPGDRAARGRSCGARFGVVLGISSKEIGDNKLSAEERTEAIVDLHGLHANEATDVLEEFLLALEQKERFLGLAYIIVGEEKHTGTQDMARGTSRARLATGVREWVHRWGYPWSERDGIICVDPLTHASE